MVVGSDGSLHHARDDGRAGRRANAGRCVEASEPRAAFRQGIDVGRLDQRVTVATEPTADVFEVDPQDVGPVVGVNRADVEAKQEENEECEAKRHGGFCFAWEEVSS